MAESLTFGQISQLRLEIMLVSSIWT